MDLLKHFIKRDTHSKAYNEQTCTVCKKQFRGPPYEDMCTDCFNKAVGIKRDKGRNRWYPCPECKGLNSEGCPKCKGWGVIQRGR